MTSSIDNASLDSLIAQLASQYKRGEPVTVTSIDRKSEAALQESYALSHEGSPRPLVPSMANKKIPSKLAISKAAKAAAKEVEQATLSIGNDKRPALVVLDLPKAGTLDAKGYFKAMSRSRTRDERIQAIAAYIGYDCSQQYAPQELASNIKARQTLRPTKVVGREVHTVLPTLKGYVSGLPDHVSKKDADLQGRQRVAVEQLANLIQQAAQASDPAVKHHAVKAAQVECLQLIRVRTELALPIDGAQETFKELEGMAYSRN